MNFFLKFLHLNTPSVGWISGQQHCNSGDDDVRLVCNRITIQKPTSNRRSSAVSYWIHGPQLLRVRFVSV
jgi:hypothetical protein